MIDQFNRRITYLRLSVIDKCNLQCMYCMPPGGVGGVLAHELLTVEEMLRLVRLFAGLGIHKVRLTGGEPLLRKNLSRLIQGLRTIPAIQEIALTTNGILLSYFASLLKRVGLDRVNVSLDTLNRHTFHRITGMDRLHDVLEGIDAAMACDFHPLKLNVVVMRGVNDHEVVALLRFAIEHNIDIRFIEVMPTHTSVLQTKQHLVASQEVKERLAAHYYLEPTDAYPSSPSRDFQVVGTRTRVGFISPLSNFFCAQCNRIRLKASGGLKTCLHGAEELNLRDLMRQGLSDAELAAQIQPVVFSRAAEHFLNNDFVPHKDFFMSHVGG